MWTNEVCVKSKSVLLIISLKFLTQAQWFKYLNEKQSQSARHTLFITSLIFVKSNMIFYKMILIYFLCVNVSFKKVIFISETEMEQQM